jgi:hypothetical protein
MEVLERLKKQILLIANHIELLLKIIYILLLIIQMKSIFKI